MARKGKREAGDADWVYDDTASVVKARDELIARSHKALDVTRQDADLSDQIVNKARIAILDQPKTSGLWKTASGYNIQIKKMRTAHIFSALRAIEKALWNCFSGNFSEIECRDIVGAAARKMKKYQELEHEFYKRWREGKLKMDDLIMGSSVPSASIR